MSNEQKDKVGVWTAAISALATFLVTIIKIFF